jgi:hypothetical protein
VKQDYVFASRSPLFDRLEASLDRPRNKPADTTPAAT